MHSGYFSLASHLYIATANAPLSDRFQEMLDMLMTGAAFGLPTALWLTNDCVSVLNALPANDSLLQLLPLLCRIGIVAITPPGMAVAKMNAIGIEKQTVKLVIRVGVKRFAGEQGGQGGGGIRRRIDQDGKLHQSSPLRAVRICSRDMNRL